MNVTRVFDYIKERGEVKFSDIQESFPEATRGDITDALFRLVVLERRIEWTPEHTYTAPKVLR